MSKKGILTFAEVISLVKLITNREKSVLITNNFDNFSSLPKATNIQTASLSSYNDASYIDPNGLYFCYDGN